MIKLVIYKVGRWMTEVYSNWAEFIIGILFVAFLLFMASIAHCDEISTIDSIVKNTNDSIAVKVEEHNPHKWNWEMALAGVSLAAIGIVDMQDHNAASYICGTPWVIAGGALVVISFQGVIQ